jgi:hypothetical protein
MRCTLESDRPESFDIDQVLQWVAALGMASSVAVTTGDGEVRLAAHCQQHDRGALALPRDIFRRRDRASSAARLE